MLGIVCLLLVIILYQGLKYFWGKRELSCGDKPNIYFLYIAILLFIAAPFLIRFYGTKIPGSFLERGGEYETMLYVRLYPNNDRVKSYKVPAKIRKEVGGFCYDEGDCESWKAYLISYAIMPNGGRIVFDEDAIVELNEISWAIDVHEREWGVELTNESVK